MDRVPTFYSGVQEDDSTNYVADFIALAVAAVFGAIYCIAWLYAFPSYMEKILWRISTITMFSIPVAIVLGLKLVDCGWERLRVVVSGVAAPAYALCGPLYILARIILLLILFTTLRSLSSVAFQTVRWTNFIPHV